MIKIIVKDKINYKELQQLFKEVDSIKGEILYAHDIFHYNWRTKKQELIVIKNSTYITARENGKLIGLLRLIEDNAYIYYFAEFMVIPRLRNKGIGKHIFKTGINYCKKNGFLKIFLSSIPSKLSFYKKFGFRQAMCTSMEIKFKKCKKEI